jgi:hypothetical protein
MSSTKEPGKDSLITRAGRALALFGVMVGTAAFLSDPVPGTDKPNPKSVRYVANETYKEECGSCHLAFLPGFLPARSWKKLMAGLEDHFGENASLDEDVTKTLTAFLVKHAADTKESTRRSKKIARQIPKGEAPLRITETAFWARKHFSVKDWVWKREKVATKAKCEACHRDADKGLYSEYDVDVPKS